MWKKFFHLLPMMLHLQHFIRQRGSRLMRLQWIETLSRTRSFFLVPSSNIRVQVPGEIELLTNPSWPHSPKVLQAFKEIRCRRLNIFFWGTIAFYLCNNYQRLYFSFLSIYNLMQLENLKLRAHSWGRSNIILDHKIPILMCLRAASSQILEHTVQLHARKTLLITP